MSTKFDTWWQIWPPGTKKGKDSARKAYANRVKCIKTECPDADPHQLLEDGLREYLMSKNWCDGFRLLPVTWLRQGRWQDDSDRAEKFQERNGNHKRVSNMDETTRAEMRRAAEVKAQRLQMQARHDDSGLVNRIEIKAVCSDGCFNKPERWVYNGKGSRTRVTCGTCGKFIGYSLQPAHESDAASS